MINWNNWKFYKLRCALIEENNRSEWEWDPVMHNKSTPWSNFDWYRAQHGVMNIHNDMTLTNIQCGRILVTLNDHYENTPNEIYWKFYHQKMKKKSDKNSDIFHISAQNIDCGYSLEPPQRGGSNEYHNLCFWAEIRKIMYTPVNPSFTI